jgi:hypothetical protein
MGFLEPSKGVQSSAALATTVAPLVARKGRAQFQQQT